MVVWKPPLRVALVASRESVDTLMQSVAALTRTLTDGLAIDILVNGNERLARACTSAGPFAHGDRLKRQCSLRLWSIALGDKAHAMNEYLHRIWPGDAPALFVDGYVRVRPDAPALLAAALASSPAALAATGVPGSGRTAARLRRKMLAEGGLHGNCFLVGAPAMKALRDAGFRLPLGLYRVDSTLGAALSFGLDPAHNEWQPLRFIRVEPRATWDVDAKPWWRPAEIRAQWRRRQRQAAGRIENRAVRNLFAERRLPPGSLPETVAQLVAGWRDADPEACSQLVSHDRLARAALERLLASRDWSVAASAPVLLAQVPGVDRGADPIASA